MDAERRIPLAARTMCSEIVERATGSPLAVVGLLGAGGSIVQKDISSRTYLYYQFREGGRTRQAYLGPATPERLESIEQYTREANDLRGLARMVLAGGGTGLDPDSFRFVRELALAGIFARGAVLVGTYAFMTYQNHLGCRWGSDLVRTLDIEAAGDRRSEVAVPAEPPVQMSELLTHIDPAIRPLWELLNPGHPPVSRNSAGGLRVDFLTPVRGRPTRQPIVIPWLGVHAQPARFLDYLIESPLPIVVLSRLGACLVRAPDPARFAIHKLLVADRRTRQSRPKATKDRRQSEVLIAALIEEDPSILEAALAALPDASAATSVHRSVAHCEQLPAPHRDWLTARLPPPSA